MRRIIIILICMLGTCPFVHSANNTDKVVANSLIVGQLLTQIGWHSDLFAHKSSSEFKLCIYRNLPAFHLFNKKLRDSVINGVSVKSENLVERENGNACHAIYLKQASPEDVEWFVGNISMQRAILIAEGFGRKVNGVHLSLFLDNSGVFDFELNPDSFIKSQHNPRRGLLQPGKIVPSQLAQDAALMRTLINYTDWPGSGSTLKNGDQFHLCAFENNPFATFANYFLADKMLKGLPVVFQFISDEGMLSSCHVLLLDESDYSHILPIMPQREKLGLLLIGRSSNIGEKGAHYNLNPHNHPDGRRFEINLLAFELTGHVPNYQLLNSAIMVEKDYPTFTQMMMKIIQFTEWPLDPGDIARSSAPMNLCFSHASNDLNNMSYFLPAYMHDENLVKIQSLPDDVRTAHCDAIYIGQSSPPLTNAIKNDHNGEQNHTLLITSRDDNSRAWMHFNLLVKPKRISLELNLRNLQNSGFILKKELLKTGIVIEGNSYD